jgi:hypothetical protein
MKPISVADFNQLLLLLLLLLPPPPPLPPQPPPLLLLLLLLLTALQPLVSVGPLYDFVPQSSVFTLLSLVSHFHLL